MPFFPGLDLLLLMVCTWSRTRCGPERSLLSEGKASDVSSEFPQVIAERSGSGAIIFLTRCPFCERLRFKCSSEKKLGPREGGERGGERLSATNSADVPSMQIDSKCSQSRSGELHPRDRAPSRRDPGEFTCRCGGREGKG